MPAKNIWKEMCLLGAISVAFFCTTLSAGQSATKLKVIYAGAPVYKEPKISEPFTTLPLDTIVEAEVKAGEFWKVTVSYKGAKTPGYVHGALVTEVREGEDKTAGASVTPQPQLYAEIKAEFEKNKEMIKQKDLAQTVDNLRPLIARAFRLENPQQQKQVVCDIYLWIGHALAMQGDAAAAIKEYRNMFEVDELAAKTAMEYASEPHTFQLISIAEKLYNRTFGGYILWIDTAPKDAVLKIDGKEIGRSPVIHKTFNPRVTLEIEKEGFKPRKETISLVEEETKLTYPLESFGRTVRVSSSPPGAAVFLDGRDTGKVTDCELPFVQYGPRTLTVKKQYYADWEDSFTVSEGSEPLAKSVFLTVKDYAPGRSWGGPDQKLYISPKALTLDKAGNFYVADESNIKLRKFNPEGLYQRTWGNQGQYFKPLKYPSGIAIDGQGNVYVTDARGAFVFKFDKNGRPVQKWGKQGVKENELNFPQGIAVDRNGDILVADSRNNRIVKYSSDGAVKKRSVTQGPGQGQLTLPTGVAVTRNNDIIVVDQSRIQKFTSDGVFVSEFGKPGSGEGEIRRPVGVCLDSEDYIYAADGANNRVLKFAPDGRFIGQFGGSGNGQLTGLAGVAVNDKGSVFVVEKGNNRIQEFRIPSK